MPIIRTFTPFVAGIGKMDYKKYTFYNIAGCVCWVSLFLFVGYGTGNIPWVQENMSLIIYAIIIVTMMPAIIAFAQTWMKLKMRNGVNLPIPEIKKEVPIVSSEHESSVSDESTEETAESETNAEVSDITEEDQ